MLSAVNLTCSRGGRPLFQGLRFALGAGHWLHVRGANGSGKTSLLRILAGLSPPDSGEVRWRGEPIASDRPNWHTDLLFLGHQAAVKDELTPLENIRVANALHGHALRDEDGLRALRRCGLKGCEDLPVSFLSAGQRRRVLLARLMTRSAALWILDEPLTALDLSAINNFSSLLREHLAGGGVAIVTTHQVLPLAGREEVLL